MSKYIYISSSISGTGTLNQYTMTVSLSTSSSAVWNNYGINVYAVIGGSSVRLGTPTISSGSFSQSTFSYTFSVGSNTNVYARAMCSSCESGAHDEYKDEFTNNSSAQTATYTNPHVIPYAPNPTISWANGTTCTSQYGDTVYRGTKTDSNADMNYTVFGCGLPGGAVRVDLYLDWWKDGAWRNIASGSPGITKYWTNAERGYAFRLRSIATSSTADSVSGPNYEWRINDLPTMDGSQVRFNVARTTNAVTLSWAHFADGLNQNNSRKYRIHLYKWNGSSYVNQSEFDVGDTTSIAFNLSDYGFAEGDKCRASVEPKDFLEWGYANYGATDVVRNSAPYFSSGTKINTNVDGNDFNKVFLDSISINYNAATDREKDTLYYDIYYKSQNSSGAWGGWIYIKADTSRNTLIACQTYVTRGRQIQFGIIARDGLDSSVGPVSITSDVLTRDDNPIAPTNVIINPDQTEEHFEAISSISWTKAIGTNGKDCSNYLIDMLICKTKDVNNASSIVSKSSSATSMSSFSIANVQRGEYFCFRIKSVDMYGLESTTYLYSKWCRRNKAPNAPRNFKVNNVKLNFFQEVALKWDAATDPDGDSITYNIYCSYNGSSSYGEIATGLTSTTYSHNISSRKPGETLGYKIISIDKYGIPSTETIIENNHKIVVNTKPIAPILIYPTSLVYDKTPRLLFKTMGDINGDIVTIKINVNGQNYYSNTSSAFNESSYSSIDSKIVFIPPSLNMGVNTIKIKSNDGFEDSLESTFIINYDQPTLNPISENADVIITVDIYNKFVNMISDSRKAYGLNTFSPSIQTARESFVTVATYNDLYNNIIQVNEWINTSYPGLNRVKFKPFISKGVVIGKNSYNSMLEIITNI